MILVVANPYSGAADNRMRVAALERALAAHGIAARVVWGTRERAAALADHGALARCRAVVAAGGDGTIAQVVNELPPGTPLAVLPSGNENLFARAFGFDGDPVRLARALVIGQTRVLDLGRASAPGRSRLFALMLSAGFDADVVHRLAGWRARAGGDGLRRVRRASYVAPIAASLLRYRHPALALHADGGASHGVWGFVANVSAYALDVPIARDARADDGALDWVVFERGGMPALARYAWSVWRGRHLARGDVRAGRGTRVRLDAPVPVPVQVDGDPWGTTPVEVEVVPRALTVISAAED